MSGFRIEPPFSGPEALRRVLQPGRTFERWELPGLIEDLERQREHIETVIAGENSRVAADWLLAMVEGCRRKLDEVEDRGGEFVCWWSDVLAVAWIRARQRARTSAEETVTLLFRLLLDEEDTIDGGWVDALNPAGLRALECEVWRRADAAGGERVRERHLRTIDTVRNRLRELHRPSKE